MKIPPGVVLDTNILISSFLTPGNSRKIVDLSARRKILVYSSPKLEEELGDKLKNKFNYNKDELSQAIISYNEIVHKFVYPQRKLKVVREDEKDNRIIEAAIEAKAKFIISGDKHLLRLGEYKNIKIINPSDLLKRLSGLT